ncbi:MAG: NUDIX domain-containing protein [archaeon]|nr:NUDIX domain-containing protein [archaeon]
MPGEDIVDIYTADRRPTGRTCVRYSPMGPGEHRQVIHICIFDHDGRMLIQHRVKTKSTFPGFWDVSVGGGVDSGETPQQAATRELREELGLDHVFDRAPAVSLDTEKVFDDFFVIRMDLDPKDLAIQESELDDVAWATRDEIEDMVREGTFIPYHPGLLDYLFHVGSVGTTEYRT